MLFLMLSSDGQDADTPPPAATAIVRPLMILGIGVIGASICAAMLDLAMIAGSLLTFGIGTCLADQLLHR